MGRKSEIFPPPPLLWPVNLGIIFGLGPTLCQFQRPNSSHCEIRLFCMLDIVSYFHHRAKKLAMLNDWALKNCWFCFSFDKSDDFLPLFFTGYGLKCYKCTSAKSWDDCDKNKEEMSCTSGFDSCGKIYFDGKVAGTGVEGYGKTCAIKSSCNKDACKAMQAGITIDKCEVNCCQGDLCNGAKVPLVSAFLILACALLAFFR